MAPAKPMRVLVTGASGFVGQPVALALAAQGYEVHGVSTRTGALPGVFWHTADLLDRAQTAALLASVQPEYLVHLAWIATPGQYQQAPENLAWARESLWLLERFAQLGGKRAVMAGSCFEYDLSYGYLREHSTPEKPDTLYGSAKLATARLAQAYAERVGVSLAWARLFYILGQRESPARAVPYAIVSALAGKPFRCQSPAGLRDYMTEQEVARALCMLLAGDIRGVVNIATGRGPAMGEIFTYIADSLQAGHLLTLGDTPPAPAVVIGDTGRLYSEVGFCPRETWQQGVDRCIAWWKQNGEGRV